MRLGAQEALLSADSLCAKIYGQERISERHRHRYEVNNRFRARLEESGLRISGRSADDLVEMVEIPSHPWFVACQFHPEFKSRPGKPSALFLGLVLASSKQLHVYMSGYEAERG